MTESLLPSTYAPLLADLKARVGSAQVRAMLSVNRELILLYWHIGREILRAQKAEGWGTKRVERLAKDLAAEFPEMKGFSSRNLKYMLAFVEAWEPIEIVQQPVAQLSPDSDGGESKKNRTPRRSRSHCSRGAQISFCYISSKSPPLGSGMRGRRWNMGGAGRC